MSTQPSPRPRAPSAARKRTPGGSGQRNTSTRTSGSPEKSGEGPRTSADKSSTKAGPRSAGQVASTPATAVVVGPVPVLVRVAGAVAILGALVQLLAPGFPLAELAGKRLGGANAADWVAILPVVAVVGAAGALCLLGRLPRFGLAVLLSAGTIGAGRLLRDFYLGQDGERSTQDLPLGIGSLAHYQAGSGLTLLTVADLLLVVAAVLAGVAWSRAVMEDDGTLDPLRPRLAGVALVIGVLAMLFLGMPAYESSIQGVPPSLLERDGLDLLGGLVVVLGVGVWAVVAATLRPRLAVVGAYLGLAAMLFTQALTIGLLGIRSPAVDVAAGTIGTGLAAIAFAGLAVAAWRLSPGTPAPEQTGQ